MKQPTKKEIQFLQIAIGMTGKMAINDMGIEFILITISEMKRLGDKFSLRDAANIQCFLNKKYNPKEDDK